MSVDNDMAAAVPSSLSGVVVDVMLDGLGRTLPLIILGQRKVLWKGAAGGGDMCVYFFACSKKRREKMEELC